MANPLLNAMMGNNFGGLSQLFSLYKNGSNPMVLLNNMAKSNPQINNIVSALQQGVNPQRLFYKLCQQQGVNPDVILNQFK